MILDSSQIQNPLTMSLTSFLSDPVHKELKQNFKTYFPTPAFDLKGELRAPPLSKNYRAVGTAFDYLLRFNIEYHNKEKCISRGGWVAERSFTRLSKRFIGQANIDLQGRFARAKENHQKFLLCGKISKDLLADCLFLGKLDLYLRSGLVAPNLLTEDNLDVKDLSNLYRVIDTRLFKAKQSCYLNPTFGHGSEIVGGADADIIIDDTLIEVKVTKYLKLEREHLNQTTGYYVLALIGGINGSVKGKAIKNIGIYFARHGLLWTVPLQDLGNSRSIGNFKKWFLDYFVKQQTK